MVQVFVYRYVCVCVGVHVCISILTSEAKYEESKFVWFEENSEKNSNRPDRPTVTQFWQWNIEFNLDLTVRGALPESLTLYSSPSWKSTGQLCFGSTFIMVELQVCAFLPINIASYSVDDNNSAFLPPTHGIKL